MLLDKAYESLIRSHASLLDASMDPICVLNPDAGIVFLNKSMSVFLGASPRTLRKCPKFCDLVELGVCKGGCKLAHALDEGKAFRVSETLAIRNKESLRISLRLIPVSTTVAGIPEGCAFMSLRDSTAEIVVQAKFHRAVDLIKQRDEAIQDLNDKVRALQKSLRDASLYRIAK
jgi:PAS domain-containing protein